MLFVIIQNSDNL